LALTRTEKIQGFAMQKKPKPSASTMRTRRRAEGRPRRQQQPQRPKIGRPKSTANTGRLLRELRARQGKLERRIAELEAARDNMAARLKIYTDRYEAAPVNYLILDRQGAIREANRALHQTPGASTVPADQAAPGGLPGCRRPPRVQHLSPAGVSAPGRCVVRGKAAD
jgi:PAS domain-containing protein